MTRRVPTFYIAQLHRVLNEHGIELAQLLERNDIALLQRPGATMSAEEFEALIATLLSSYQLSDLGLELGRRLTLSHHGPLGLAIVNCPTVNDIIRVVCDYLPIRVPNLMLSVSDRGEDKVVVVHNSGWHPLTYRFIVDALSTAFLNLQRVLVANGNKPVIREVVFNYEKLNSTLPLTELGEPPVRYNQPYCGVILNKSFCSSPLKGDDPISLDYAKHLCELEKQSMAKSSLVSDRLVEHFSQCDTLSGLSDAAAALCMSKRTLHRALIHEGTNFQQIKDTCLMRRATELLFVHNTSVKSAAHKLGYSDTANFRRAFKRWFGISPSLYRSASYSKK